MMERSLKKTLAAALLALVFLFDILPMDARAAMKGELWVSGKKVTENKLSGDGWRYAPETNTLTLENYTYIGNGKKKKNGNTMWCAGLYYEGAEPLKIVLAGENRISVADAANDGGVTCGILCYGALEIGGEGSLTAISGAAGDSYGVYCYEYAQTAGTVSLAADRASVRSYGIYVHTGDVSVSGGTLEARGAESDNWSCGIWCNGGFSLSGGDVRLAAGKARNNSYGLYTNTADVTIDGGSLSTVSGEAGSYSAGIFTLGNMTVNGGDVSAASGEAPVWIVGIWTEGDLTVLDGTVRAVGANVKNGAADTSTTNGIFAYGTITIDGGAVTAEAGNAFNNEATGIMDSQGMVAMLDLCINNGTVTVKAGNAHDGSYAMVALGDIVINGGNVTAISGDAAGGEECESLGIDACGENHDGQEGQSSKIFINGGTVSAQAGSAAGNEGCSEGIYGYEVNVAGGSVTAAGDEAQALDFLCVRFPD